MAVITMPPTNLPLLLKRIRIDFSDYSFVVGNDFIWSPDLQQITYKTPVYMADIWSLLHEIAHAKLSHNTYTLDVELIAREVDAWRYAQKKLAPAYGLEIDQNYIEDHLDTYRFWLHQRSRCPQCNQNGFQTSQNTYNCNNCRCLWRVNEARRNRLKRVRLQGQDHSS
jgi:hypothetical protein